MPPKPSLRAFLSLARSKLAAPPTQRELPLTFVVGNESADLDSLCSAVMLAYLKSNSANSKFHIPLSNLSKEELTLRTEMTAVLTHAGLKPDDLLTLDDLPSGPESLKPEDTSWFLVDHNALTGRLKQYSHRVASCIDHHVDEGKLPANCSPRILETCGSCVSLIAEHARDAWDELAREAKTSPNAKAADRGLALMGLSVIFSDTVNLTARDKVTSRDEAAVEYLEGKVLGPDSGYNRKEYCDEIARVRLDISGLSLRDIFRKDYKEWSEGGKRLGTCSVIQSFQYLLDKAGSEGVFVEELAKFAEQKELDLVSVMTLSTAQGGVERETLLWARNAEAVPCGKKFEEISGVLQLIPFREGHFDLDGETEWRKWWTQGDKTKSRKQIAPLMRKAMEPQDDTATSQDTMYSKV